MELRNSVSKPCLEDGNPSGIGKLENVGLSITDFNSQFLT